ncbi:MAG: response regulator [Candidatus Nanohaloarchaea archaeon]
MKALVTEDSSFMRKILVNILEDLGFDEIKEAENGEQAVEKYRDSRPDIVLLDIVMEEMGGIEALKQIKEMESDATVIMISAVGQQEMVDEAMDLGAEEFVEKPFENDDVKATIKDVLDME